MKKKGSKRAKVKTKIRYVTRSVKSGASRARRRYSSGGGLGLRNILQPLPIVAGVAVNMALDQYNPIIDTSQWEDWKEYGQKLKYKRDMNNIITGIVLPMISKKFGGTDYLQTGLKNLITDFVETKVELPSQANEWQFKML